LAPPQNFVFQSHVKYPAAKAGPHPAAPRPRWYRFRRFENRSTYHRTVVSIAVGDVLFFEASLKTAGAAMTRANNAIIAAISIDLGSRRRLSEFLCMTRAPAADASE
jgi:hypothetical protein